MITVETHLVRWKTVNGFSKWHTIASSNSASIKTFCGSDFYATQFIHIEVDDEGKTIKQPGFEDLHASFEYCPIDDVPPENLCKLCFPPITPSKAMKAVIQGQQELFALEER